MRVICVAVFSIPFLLKAQVLADRIEADYSIKEVSAEGKQSLVVGKVFFDKQGQTLTHSQTFPTKNTFAFRDSTVLLLFEDSVVQGSSSVLSIELSIYNLILSNRTSDLGLRSKGFNLIDVQEKEGKVTAQWRYPGAEEFGTIMVIQDKGFLDGLVFYGQNGEAMLKQYFRDYKKVGSVFFPEKIYESNFTPKGEHKKITTHRNIKVNDFADEDNFYYLSNDSYERLIRSEKD